MPGICGFAGSLPHGDADRRLTEMTGRMTHHPWYRQSLYIEPASCVALGQVSLGDGWDAAGPAIAAGESSAAFLDGEVYGMPLALAQRRLLEACAMGANPDPWLASLHGLFSGAVWDAAKRRLLLVNDRFGMKPLFYAREGGRLVFASEVKALLRCSAVSRALDPQGLVSFFHYGQPLGEHTFFAGVRALPPGAVLEYRPAEDSLVERRYFRLTPRRLEAGMTDAEHVTRLGEMVKAAVDRRLSNARMGLSLSGGLDSRTILAVVDEKRFPMTTICLGIPGCIDQRASRRMAALTASRHCDFIIDRTFLDRFEEHLRELVWLTDGHHRAQVISLPTLPKYRELGIEVLFRGHAGEVLHMRKAYDYSLDPELANVRDAARLEAWLWRRLGGWMLQGVEGPLLKGMTREELDERGRVLLRDLLCELGEDDPLVHRVWRLFITQRLRRHVAAALLEYGSLVRVRLPYLDNDLIDAVLASPPALKMGDTIQARLLARYRPELLGVVNANTGVRIGAGPLRRWLGTFRCRAFAKLRVPGYQPYERLGLWLRRELRPLSERILLDSRCLDRGVFEPETLRRILAAHADHRANHTFIIMTMLIFELGQRMLLEGEERQVARTV